ncbi:hypothetical protein [Bacteroides sp. 51]|uniref:hypothetical protein n=1 Tax=Bacteroides sp. 51 TaxID=2302938 RepID=UPI0013D74E6D|nr:hypothetical protein [Bacteroides sp. 51]NDV81341.1 hypothetical protein [Bacteroides sp. 51]
MKQEKELKEELTTAMHSEFTVDAETDLKHRVWSILSSCKNQNKTVNELIDQYDLSMDDIEKYKQSYFDLLK